MSERPRGPRRGFTLTEMLVVVSIITIAMSFLLLGVSRMYTSAMQLKCQHRMEQVWQACLTYSSASHGMWPSAWDYDKGKAWYENMVEAGYLDDSAAIGCPLEHITPGVGTPGQDPGVPQERREAILDALRWLAANQVETGDNEGMWGTIDRTTNSGYNCGPTALGLEALLGYGCNTQLPTEFANTVTKALRYLLNNQRDDGWWWKDGGHGDYDQAVCAMAVCDAYNMMGDLKFTINGQTKSLKTAAQRAIDCLVNTRQNATYGGFKYGCSSGKSNDVSTAVWGYQAMKSAMNTGLVPAGASDWSVVKTRWEKFLRYAKSDIDPRSSYRFSVPAEEGGGDYMFKGLTDDTPARMTAGVLLARLFLGHKPTDQDVKDQLGWLTGKDEGQADPRHIRIANRTGTNVSSGGYDLYFVYYMTLALFEVGGSPWTNWITFGGAQNGFVDKLLYHQVKTGNYAHADGSRGSWITSMAPYGGYGGRVYPTALGCIALELSVADYLPGSKWCIAGQHSYGYNKLLGCDRRTPAPDTVVLFDYLRWGIDPTDPAVYVSARHGGRVNVLYADGHVEARTAAELIDGDRIKASLLSLDSKK